LIDIGTGIIAGSAIIGGVAAIHRIFPRNNNNKYVKKEMCDIIHDGLNQRLDQLDTTLRENFSEVKNQIVSLQMRVDRIKDD